MIIRWLEDAIEDLKSLKNPSAAQRVAKKIINSVNLLIDQPGIGRKGRVANTRELLFPIELKIMK